MASISFEGIIDDCPKNGLKNFHIAINGIYSWGSGFGNYKNSEVWDKMCRSLGSKRNIEKIFGDNVVFVKGGMFESDRIVSVNKYCKKNVYLHPYDMTGYLTEEQINNLVDYINKYFKKIDGYDVTASIYQIQDSAHLSDAEYESMIFAKSKEIIERVREYYDSLDEKGKERFRKYEYSDMGSAFVKTARILREGDSTGLLGSDDVDWRTVTHIVEMAMDNGLLPSKIDF